MAHLESRFMRTTWRPRRIKPAQQRACAQRGRSRRYGESIYHPVGTCKMGPASDASAVVDHKLKLHGIDRLRVADCAIMPELVSGNTHAPAVAIGEKAAELVRLDRS